MCMLAIYWVGCSKPRSFGIPCDHIEAWVDEVIVSWATEELIKEDYSYKKIYRCPFYHYHPRGAEKISTLDTKKRKWSGTEVGEVGETGEVGEEVGDDGDISPIPTQSMTER
jgi:hypothetical protein